MPDLNLAVEPFSWENLALEVHDLSDWKLSSTHNQDAVLTHFLDKAGNRSVPGI